LVHSSQQTPQLKVTNSILSYVNPIPTSTANYQKKNTQACTESHKPLFLERPLCNLYTVAWCRKTTHNI